MKNTNSTIKLIKIKTKNRNWIETKKTLGLIKFGYNLQ